MTQPLFPSRQGVSHRCDVQKLSIAQKEPPPRTTFTYYPKELDKYQIQPFSSTHGSILFLIAGTSCKLRTSVYFYPTIALHVSVIIITHLQEHKTTVTTASGNRYTVFLSVAFVEELELTSSRKQFQIFHDSSRQQYGVTVTRCCSYICFVLLKMGDGDARNM